MFHYHEFPWYNLTLSRSVIVSHRCTHNRLENKFERCYIMYSKRDYTITVCGCLILILKSSNEISSNFDLMKILLQDYIKLYIYWLLGDRKLILIIYKIRLIILQTVWRPRLHSFLNIHHIDVRIYDITIWRSTQPQYFTFLVI